MNELNEKPESPHSERPFCPMMFRHAIDNQAKKNLTLGRCSMSRGSQGSHLYLYLLKGFDSALLPYHYSFGLLRIARIDGATHSSIERILFQNQ